MLPDRLQLYDCLQIFGAAGGAFGANQRGQIKPTAGKAENLRLEAVSQEIVVTAAARNLAEQVDWSYTSLCLKPGVFEL